jgi:phosphoribosylglycinamide formyltransferase-1
MRDASAEFVSEALEPEHGTADLFAMSRGEPGLPRAFQWRGTRYEIAQVAAKWKTSSRERGDLYLRRHWFEVVTTTGQRMTVYCDRQVKNRRKPKARWWLYSIVRASV